VTSVHLKSVEFCLMLGTDWCLRYILSILLFLHCFVSFSCNWFPSKLNRYHRKLEATTGEVQTFLTHLLTAVDECLAKRPETYCIYRSVICWHYVLETLVEWYWHAKSQALGEKLDIVPLRPPEVPPWLAGKSWHISALRQLGNRSKFLSYVEINTT
jgi:hypothetical protein